jgi:hypothetical protein
MKLAFRTDAEIRLEVFPENDGAAGFALHPQPFGTDAALFGWRRLFNRFFIALKPGHFSS